MANKKLEVVAWWRGIWHRVLTRYLSRPTNVKSIPAAIIGGGVVAADMAPGFNPVPFRSYEREFDTSCDYVFDFFVRLGSGWLVSGW